MAAPTSGATTPTSEPAPAVTTPTSGTAKLDALGVDADPVVRGPLKEGFFFDKLGRKRVAAPRNGPLHITSRACKFHPITAANHFDTIKALAEKICPATGRTFGGICVDSGPDWDLTTKAPNIYAWRVLKELDGAMDGMQFVCNAARFSRFNNIEHAWSPLTNALTSVRFSAVATGDEVAPCKLPAGAVSDGDRVMKEVEVFDNGVAE
jgi:hypothetical protein